MNLNQARAKLAKTPVYGWDGTSWVADVLTGSVEAYTRFINERTFGVLNRVFVTAVPIDAKYTMLRLLDGTRFMVSKEVTDYSGVRSDGYVYHLQEATHDADIIGFTAQPSASGMGRQAVDNIISTVPCHYERTSDSNSTIADAVSYMRVKMLFPKGTVITTDNEIAVNGERFTVREVDQFLDLVRVFIVGK